ncbi:histone deacetylase [Rufibacter glacialis]|uniref:Histone deacetylase n=1 Tax=Rufibacter glacialis TaxID=1259555 RepID=A0A5M8Q5L5_9BACT|nr:histone deacetylase [Rufibacter glacialis]KAA6430206.1 histone deacetylase [Rufibacter glacialis]GGK87267.1 histone deacetylase [Rufibacter glacialis]
MLKIAWSPEYAHPLPENHRFPMLKYELLPEQLLYEGTVTQENFFQPAPLADAVIERVHEPGYWRRLRQLELSPSEVRKTGFPLSRELVNREIIIMGGTVEAAAYALEFGMAMNIAGGTHHAFTDRGEGFCLLNDNALAAQSLLDEGKAQQVLIVDLDVHQGNGTAQIFAEEPRVFTFSMHGGNNYPLHKETSDLDVPLPDGIGDAAYLQLLHAHLPALFDRVAPDFVFFQCGVDVLATDKLGKLGLTHAGCKERDRLVLELCHQNRVPVVASMGGGYSTRIADIVEAHANTFRLAQQIFF